MKKQLKNYRVLALTVCTFALMGAAAPVKAEDGFTDTQKEEINALIKDYIMKNPSVVLDSVDKFQRDEQVRVRRDAEKKLQDFLPYYQADDLPVAGNPEGDVTVVEYFDYNCSYCKRAYADIMKLIKEDKNLRVVFQDLPVLGQGSEVMGRFSIASHKQGKYFDFHQALMAYKGPNSEEALLKVAEKAGLDVGKLKEDIHDPLVDLAIEKQRQMAASMGITGTPGFIIGGKLFPGYIGYDGLKNEIAGARKALEEKAASEEPAQ